MYNFINVKSISEFLIHGKGYDTKEVSSFITNKLPSLLKVEDLNSKITEETSILFISNDIIDQLESFNDNEIKMTRDIILDGLGNPLYFFKVIDEYNIIEKVVEILKKLNVNIEIFKKVIEKQYRINNPQFSDYDDFIQYSFIIMRFLTKEELAQLDKEVLTLDDNNIKYEVSYYKALMSRIAYGMRYAGEPGDNGYSFHGIEKIRKYSECINNDNLIEILNYIAYEETYVINNNYRSIKELIDNSLKNIHKNSDNLGYLEKFYGFFYIDFYYLFEYITDIAFDYISQLEDYQDYSYISSRNNMKVNKSQKKIIREILNKKDSKSGDELVIHEVKDIENEIIRYIAKEIESNKNEKIIMEIEFKYLEMEEEFIHYIVNPRNEENKLEAQIKYNYDKPIYSRFGQVLINGKTYKNIYDFQNEVEKYIKIENVNKEVVEILYLYVDNMYGYPNKNFRLCFDNSYLFRIDDKAGNDSIEIEICRNPDKSIVNGFFAINDELNSNILNIYALLGKNGAGKTSIINLIRNSGMFGSENNFDEETRYCLIFKISSTVYWISSNDKITVKNHEKKINLTKRALDDDKNYMSTSVIFFSNIVNLSDKKNISFNVTDRHKHNIIEQQIDLSNQFVYNWELESVYNSKYNDSAIKLIRFSSKYYNDDNYLQILTSNRNTKEENEDDKYKFEITVLDYVYVDVITKSILLDDIPIKLVNSEVKYGSTFELNDIDQQNVFNILNNIFNLNFGREYEIVRDIVFKYYEEKKYIKFMNNTYNESNFIEVEDIIWKCIEKILSKQIIIDKGQEKAEEKYKIIVNIIVNYYKNKSYIEQHEVKVLEDDVVWKCVYEIDQKTTIINEYRFKIELRNGQLLIELLNEIISNFEKSEMNFIFYQINSLSTGQMARLNLFSTLDYYWNQEDITGRIKKKNYILILDEAETSFHPEWQRTFIYDLIYFLEFQKENNRAFNSIQIIISSNSPFIISDLPNRNLIFLDEKKGDAISGLGQNIHSLLSEAFFMKSTIGEFAKTKISKIISDLNVDGVQYLKDNKYNVENRIKIIGEPIIRNKLLDMLYKKLYTLENKASEINYIEEKINELQSMRNELQNNKNI